MIKKLWCFCINLKSDRDVICITTVVKTDENQVILNIFWVNKIDAVFVNQPNHKIF